MFENSFSFNGRIGRTEYACSFILYHIGLLSLNIIVDFEEDTFFNLFIFMLIPMFWFLWAQGAKRCHDLGNSGWWQLVPFFIFWLIFAKGKNGRNQYDDDPHIPSKGEDIQVIPGIVSIEEKGDRINPIGDNG